MISVQLSIVTCKLHKDVSCNSRYCDLSFFVNFANETERGVEFPLNIKCCYGYMFVFHIFALKILDCYNLMHFMMVTWCFKSIFSNREIAPKKIKVWCHFLQEEFWFLKSDKTINLFINLVRLIYIILYISLSTTRKNHLTACFLKWLTWITM